MSVSKEHSVSIGRTELKYRLNEDKYIVTYINRVHTEELYSTIDTIFNVIFPYYNSRKLEYSNVCGANAEYICDNLKIDGLTLGKIIITDWVIRNKNHLDIIRGVYGPIIFTIGASYHALAYIELTIEKITYYIAIETTICTPYKLQFYIGSSKEEFETIIHTRYQCSDFKITFDCKKSWMDIAYPSMHGGKKSKRKMKNKKRRHTRKILNKTVNRPSHR